MTPETRPEDPDRDARGRWRPGCRPGPGNPYARRVAALRQALVAAVTAQDIADIAASLLQAAKGGDVPAATLLLQRALGRPEAAEDAVACLRADLGGIDLGTIDGIAAVQRAAVGAAAAGRITLAAAERLAALGEKLLRTYETVDLLRRIEALEGGAR